MQADEDDIQTIRRTAAAASPVMLCASPTSSMSEQMPHYRPHPTRLQTWPHVRAGTQWVGGCVRCQTCHPLPWPGDTRKGSGVESVLAAFALALGWAGGHGIQHALPAAAAPSRRTCPLSSLIGGCVRGVMFLLMRGHDEQTATFRHLNSTR